MVMVLLLSLVKSFTTISFLVTVAIIDSFIVMDKLLVQSVPSVVLAVTTYSPPKPINILESTPAIFGAKACPLRVQV